MGLAKAQMMEEDDRGWRSAGDDTYVCSACMDDYALKEFVEQNAEFFECSYCDHESTDGNPISVSLDQVLALIMESIHTEWSHPAAELPYETREGGWQGRVIDTRELLAEIEIDIENEELIQDICDLVICNEWCKRHYYSLSEDQKLSASWGQFTRIVKHEIRYLFSLPNAARDEADNLDFDRLVPPNKILDKIGYSVADADLVKILRKHSVFYRARVHDPGEKYLCASELGPPPRDKAKYSNRMSPAGIPLFYGANDVETAIAETYEPRNGKDAVATVGFFQAMRDLRLLDLACDLQYPSLFDAARRHLRTTILFLRDFVSDLSRPIVKDGREHIEYIPTQVVTEYFRRCFRDSEGDTLDGLLYQSSRNKGGICCVLFAQQEHCIDLGEKASEETQPLLALDTKKTIRVPLSVPP